MSWKEHTYKGVNRKQTFTRCPIEAGHTWVYGVSETRQLTKRRDERPIFAKELLGDRPQSCLINMPSLPWRKGGLRTYVAKHLWRAGIVADAANPFWNPVPTPAALFLL